MTNPCLTLVLLSSLLATALYPCLEELKPSTLTRSNSARTANTRGWLHQFKNVHPGGVLSVAFLHNGQQALSSGVDDTAQIWDLTRGFRARRFTGKEFRFQSLALSPDGRYVLSPAKDAGVRYWDLESGNDFCRLNTHGVEVSRVTISEDGRVAASNGRDR